METTVIPFRPFGAPEAFQVPALIRSYQGNGLPILELSERFILRGARMGSWTIPWFRTNGGELHTVSSTAFFCPRCAEIWARRVILNEWWSVESRLCDRHGYGSLLWESDLQLLGYLPLAVISYEFILETNHGA